LEKGSKKRKVSTGIKRKGGVIANFQHRNPDKNCESTGGFLGFVSGEGKVHKGGGKSPNREKFLKGVGALWNHQKDGQNMSNQGN